MSSAMMRSYEQLQIQPFEIRIQEVSLHTKVYDHERFTFTGMIPEEKEEQYVRIDDESTAAELFLYGRSGSKTTLVSRSQSESSS